MHVRASKMNGNLLRGGVSIELFKVKILNMPFFSLIQDFVLRNDF